MSHLRIRYLISTLLPSIQFQMAASYRLLLAQVARIFHTRIPTSCMNWSVRWLAMYRRAQDCRPYKQHSTSIAGRQGARVALLPAVNSTPDIAQATHAHAYTHTQLYTSIHLCCYGEQRQRGTAAWYGRACVGVSELTHLTMMGKG